MFTFLGHSVAERLPLGIEVMQEQPKRANLKKKNAVGRTCGSNQMCVLLQKKHAELTQDFGREF